MINNEKPTGVIILAAGKGTRMKSEKPKVCFELAGKSLVQRVVNTGLQLDASLIGVVVGFKRDLVKKSIIEHKAIKYIYQEEQNGTGSAVICTKEAFKDFNGNIFILCGDVPLLKAETLSKMLQQHKESQAVCTVLTMILDNPDKYGRIVRENLITGKIKEIVEYKDANEEIRKINEINTGIYCFNSKDLYDALDKIDNNNAQNEYYLTDVIKIFYQENKVMETVLLEDVNEAAGVNSQLQLSELEYEHYQYINRYWLSNGVTIENPSTVQIQEDVIIENDVTICANTKLSGNTRIGKNTYIGMNSYISNSIIAQDSSLKGYNVVINANYTEQTELDWMEKKIYE
ncbi:MAG: sugar phosphate nucleotidyltransferase [Candidatus Cloacimonetes bacterium]|nr:sugar phosphate nucleotidyltransferase [Candidatus Cloacimonadota bacterium]